MKITKDTKNDLAYIQLRKGRVQKSIELSPGLIFDYDKAGEIIGIEILSLKKLAPLLGSPKKRTTARRSA
jgi:uncharacterized protein YuzE